MTDQVWLAASYCLPALYSCRTFGSGIGTATALPGPGPATVRLALIRASIEMFGLDYTQRKLFVGIRDAQVAVRPPERVAFTVQRYRGYKPAIPTSRVIPDESYRESIMIRECAHALGPLEVFVNVRANLSDELSTALKAIGYWGQKESIATCLKVQASPPPSGEFAIPLESYSGKRRGSYYTSFVTEFRDVMVRWEEVVLGNGTAGSSFLRPSLFIWPLVTDQHQFVGRILNRENL